MANGPTLIPGLFYDDPNAALDWLAQGFGFERGAEPVSGPRMFFAPRRHRSVVEERV
jgi:uncharacterized glyoxalase superfamily protein PhnB